MITFILKLVVFALIAAVVSFYFSERSGPTVVQRLATPTVSISDVVHNPSKYDGSAIQIAGKPVPGARFSMLGFGGYFIEDGAGNRVAILVKKGIPSTDQATATVTLIGVIGVMKNLIEIGSFSYPVLVLD
jgi:hypothetical protein